MKISLVQNEIEEALVEYLQTKIHLAENQKFNIELNATRGAAGFTAEISIEKNNPVKSAIQVRGVELPVVTKPADTIPNPYSVTGSINTEPVKEEVKPKKSFFANLA